MGGRKGDEVFSVTSAPVSPAKEREQRSRRYAIAMSIRMGCFILVWFLPGWWKLAAVLGAILLPYVAVVIANAGHEEQRKLPPPVPPIVLPAIEGRTDHLGSAS